MLQPSGACCLVVASTVLSGASLHPWKPRAVGFLRCRPPRAAPWATPQHCRAVTELDGCAAPLASALLLPGVDWLPLAILPGADKIGGGAVAPACRAVTELDGGAAPPASALLPPGAGLNPLGLLVQCDRLAAVPRRSMLCRRRVDQVRSAACVGVAATVNFSFEEFVVRS